MITSASMIDNNDSCASFCQQTCFTVAVLHERFFLKQIHFAMEHCLQHRNTHCRYHKLKIMHIVTLMIKYSPASLITLEMHSATQCILRIVIADTLHPHASLKC